MTEVTGKTDDSEGYKSQPASVIIDPPSKTPFNNGHFPLSESNECPMCLGKGFVKIVKERKIPRRDVTGKLIGGNCPETG